VFIIAGVIVFLAQVDIGSVEGRLLTAFCEFAV
jgi:hypothetical protein